MRCRNGFVLAGAKVAPEGKAVGIDFSEDMVARGNEIAKKYQRKNVEFYYSQVEEMPFLENTFDVVISNCVLNLVPDKIAAFSEIHRVTKKDIGRFVVSDTVLKKPLPKDLANDIAAIVRCIGRAVTVDKYRDNLEKAGFKTVEIIDKKIDMMKLHKEKGENMEKSGKKLDLTIFQKYDLNEYVMSCIVKAHA